MNIKELFQELKSAYIQIGETQADLVRTRERLVQANALASRMKTETDAVRPASIRHEALVEMVRDSRAGQKIQVIRLVRELTGLGLKDAKGLVDRAWPPQNQSTDGVPL